MQLVKLYEKVYSKHELNDFGFIGDTLFRTNAGYDIYERFRKSEELMNEMNKIVELTVDLQTGSIKPRWKTKVT